MPRGRSLPPDPSRPDQLKDMMRQQVEEFLKDPLNYPNEMVDWVTQFTSLNSIQSVTA